MAMVYTLTDTIREWLLEHNIAGQDGSMHAEMLKRMHMKEKQKKKDEDHAAAAAMVGRNRGLGKCMSCSPYILSNTQSITEIGVKRSY